MNRYTTIILFLVLSFFVSDAFSADAIEINEIDLADRQEWFDRNLNYQPDFATSLNAGRFHFGLHKFDIVGLNAWNPKDFSFFQSSFNSSYSVDGISNSSLKLSVTGENEIKMLDSYATDEKYLQMNPGKYRVGIQTQGQILDLAIHYSESNNPIPDTASMLSKPSIPAKWQLVSAGVSKQFAGFGVHAEGGHGRISSQESLSETDLTPGKIYDSFLVGVDYTFDNGLFLLLEYYQEGENRAYDGLSKMDADLGDSLGLSNKKVFIGAKYPITDMTSVELFNFLHAGREWFILNPWLILNSGNFITIKLSAEIPVQKKETLEKPVPSAYGHIQLNF